MAKIFISYNRQREAIVRSLANDIESMGHTVWLAHELSGGQAWWDQILATVRDCSIFIFVLSPEGLNSTACQREYTYAEQLGKPVLPVLVSDGVSTKLLPPALSKIETVDYRKQDGDAVIRLARALSTIPPTGPLPDPLPDSPDAPISYLGGLTEQVDSTVTLSYPEQTALLVDLKRSLRDPENTDDARTLLQKLRKRRDLFATIAEDVDELLRGKEKPIVKSVDAVTRPASMTRYCTKCGAVNDDTAQYCVSCRAPLSPVSGYQPMQSVNQVTNSPIVYESAPSNSVRSKSDGSLLNRLFNRLFGGLVYSSPPCDPRVTVQQREGGPDDFRTSEITTETEAVEEVDATVYAPGQAAPGDNFLVLIYAHLPAQASAVEEEAKAVAPDVKKRFSRTLDQWIKRGAKLTFNLTMPELGIDEPSQSLIWRGKPKSVQFGITVPMDARPRTTVGTVIVCEGTVPIGHLKFTLAIVRSSAEVASGTQPVSAGSLIRYKWAFISYASPDRSEVLKRVQMLNASKVNFFQDLLTLEPGDHWEDLIYKYIDQSDVFFLFWSEAASRSPWVKREIAYAIERKARSNGTLPEIVPVIIEGPPPAKPPKELAFLHFNDRFMYFVKAEEMS